MTYQLRPEGKAEIITVASQDIVRAGAEAFNKLGAFGVSPDIYEDAQPSATGPNPRKPILNYGRFWAAL